MCSDLVCRDNLAAFHGAYQRGVQSLAQKPLYTARCFPYWSAAVLATSPGLAAAVQLRTKALRHAADQSGTTAHPRSVIRVPGTSHEAGEQANLHAGPILFHALTLKASTSHLRYYSSSSSASCTNGFAISSLPSTGEMSTSIGPRATSRPRGRVLVLPSSSVEGDG